MRVVSVSPRRRQLCAIGFDCPSDELPVGEELPAGRRFDQDGLLLLDRATAEEAGLAPGRELSGEELFDLIGRSDFSRARSRALWLLGSRDYASAELCRKLAAEFGEKAAGSAVRRMEELGLIDDEVYAARLAERLLCGKKVSARDAVYQMTSRGISRETAESAVEAISPDPAVQLRALIEQKYIRSLSDEKGVRRVTAALARRGFSYSDIRAALRPYVSEEQEEW